MGWNTLDNGLCSLAVTVHRKVEICCGGRAIQRLAPHPTRCSRRIGVSPGTAVIGIAVDREPARLTRALRKGPGGPVNRGITVPVVHDGKVSDHEICSYRCEVGDAGRVDAEGH